MRSIFLLFATACTLAVALVCAGFAQVSQTAPETAGAVLTLPQAEAIALRNQPRLQAAQLHARAVKERIREQELARLPSITFNATGALVADTGTATAAGALTTSSLSDRFAYGGTLVQLITDLDGRARLSAQNARRPTPRLTGQS